jgi:aldehyde:ferredoxin oxidoreductase
VALNRKIAYIDLTSGTIRTRPIPLEMRKKYLGGRGLDAYLLYNHTERGADPLGPDNALLVSAGFLGGTLASATARTHVCAKSPLTGFFGSANMGGFFAPELRWAGFDHLVIKGKAPKPVYLWIHDGQIEIRDAANVWGLNVHETQRAIRNELGDEDVKCVVIGPAGEKLVRYANVMTGLKNSGGRTGMGAVFGSKNLKAVAARGTMDIRIAHPTQALEYNKKFIEQITSSKANKTPGDSVYLGRNQLLGRREGPEFPVQPDALRRRHRAGADRRDLPGDHGPLSHGGMLRLPGALPLAAQDSRGSLRRRI